MRYRCAHGGKYIQSPQIKVVDDLLPSQQRHIKNCCPADLVKKLFSFPEYIAL